MGSPAHYLITLCSGNCKLLLQLLNKGSLLCQVLLQLLLCCSVPLPYLLLGIGRCGGCLRLFGWSARAAGGCPAVGFLQGTTPPKNAGAGWAALHARNADAA